jgi:hypothetical protein
MITTLINKILNSKFDGKNNPIEELKRREKLFVI